MDNYVVPCISDKITSKAKEEIHYINVPGSKSITNRALLLASLAEGKSDLENVLFSDDSRHFLDCIEHLGINVITDEQGAKVTLFGNGKTLPFDADLYVGSAGTAARFLTAVLGVSKGIYHLTSSEQMKKRPMAPLLDALKEIGCVVNYEDVEGHFPFSLKSYGFTKHDICINIDSSSQFLSALLIASVLSSEDLTINLQGSHGMAYIEMTRKMMQQFGVTADYISDDQGRKYIIKANQNYNSMDYSIEPDVSAASYFYAICPILGIKVCVPGVHWNSLQGDVQFIHALEQMGCSSIEDEQGIILMPPTENKLNGITIDMSSFSDQAITLAIVATYASTPTTITGIGHIRLQESDRLSAIATELSNLGINVEEKSDSITIYPGNAHKGCVNTYDDHRIAMGFSLLGLKNPGITINDPGCCSKTFENYFDVLDSLIEECI